jgi:putative nucleotidyltransferase with HDIG domain
MILMNRLKNTEQSLKHHPEGNVWNHTMLVVDEAAKVKDESRNQKAFMWAAFLHDIGKGEATKNHKGKITSYDHDKIGAKLAKSFLTEYSRDQELIKEVVALVRWHMQILFVLNKLPFADVKTMKREVDIKEIALIGLCDRLGRLGADRSQEESNVIEFIQKCKMEENEPSKVNV